MWAGLEVGLHPPQWWESPDLLVIQSHWSPQNAGTVLMDERQIKNVPSGQEQASASSRKWNKRINYPQCSVALVLALVQGRIPPWEVGVSVREQAGLEVECIWRPWGCWWCGFQPTCCDRRPANQQQWHWEEDGGVRSLVTPEGQQSTAFMLEEIVVIIQ